LALVVVPFSLHSFGQSVADIAKKERERQRATESKVVVSSGRTVSMSTTPVQPAPTASSTTPATTASPAKEPAKPFEATDNKGRNEQYWRGVFQKARESAQRAEARAELLDLRLKELNTSLLRQTDVYNRENRIGAEITATQKEIDEARKLAAQAKKNIADLEDELRKSGGPAGWAR
jgi:hypothetical protein